MKPYAEYEAEAQHFMDIRKERTLTFKESMAFDRAVYGMLQWVEKWSQPTAYEHLLGDDVCPSTATPARDSHPALKTPSIG